MTLPATPVTNGTTITQGEIDQLRRIADDVEAILALACISAPPIPRIDLIYDARNRLADLRPTLARIVHAVPFVEPDQAQAQAWAQRKPTGQLQD